jgi:hypothetical protein
VVEASVQVFSLPKHGNTADEYEDAYAYSTHRFAIADGATESSYAEPWARGMVKQFIDSPPKHIRVNPIPLAEWIGPLQKEWQRAVPWDRLPWYAEEKARTGAFSTFLGIEITPTPTKFKLLDLFRTRKGIRWHALAVGDSCFFQIREDALSKSFPFEKSEQFNSRPLLISSNPARNIPVWKSIRTCEGDCKNNDIFVLATDALAQWFLKEHESGKKPWQALLKLKTPEEFAAFVECQRKKGMRNDDTTLVLCHWKDGEKKS